jgi:soluble lytic murein transglycosylase-like protein
MVFYAFLMLGSANACAQETAQTAMQASIEKQKASVRRQTLSAVPQAALPPAPSWFTVPWPPASVSDTPIVDTSHEPQSGRAQVPSIDCDHIAEPQLSPMIRDAASREGLKEDLVRAVIQRESMFKPCAVSPKGAQGLMQLMPATANDLGVSDPFDPKQNIDAGTRYLKQLLTRYNGNIELALGAYNAGPSRVDKAGGVPNIPETKTYVLEILNKLLF